MKVADCILRVGVFKRFKYFLELETYSLEQLKATQKSKLESLLIHSFNNVPYYREVLGDCGVVVNNTVDLDRFENIPILNKAIIREQGERLYAKDYKSRHHYKNTSGGSTGEPVTFIQDWEYKKWSVAARFYYNTFINKYPGDREVKLWGAERDIFTRKKAPALALAQWLFNMKVLNSFDMSGDSMKNYIEQWNRFRPSLVWSYTSSIHELCRFAKQEALEITPPNGVICTAETLTEEVREFIEIVVKAPVLNQYGSREIGIGGCECTAKSGLHIFPHINYMEILDESGKALGAESSGNIHVTLLTNYSMPLIRYQIGDTGCLASAKKCSCGRSWPKLRSVTGRISDHFRSSSGKIVHGEFFTHLFYNKKNIKQFQFIQKQLDEIDVNFVGTLSDNERNDIASKINIAMASDCKINFNHMDNIERAVSGKYRYTISKI